MRNLALSSLLVTAALVAPAHADRKDIKADRVAAATAGTERTGAQLSTGRLDITGPARKDVFLEASEVAAEVRPYSPAIERCYLERLGDVRHAGRLDLTFVIGRDGHVVSLGAKAPGLPARTVERVSSCIHEAIDGLVFPVRRSDTTAIVPYYFQHTNTPGGGPQLSCWKPKGCHVDK
ncbi:MAG TPA: hypothetical protein VIX73_33195 [Kofleriaceae bacterium]